jgi:hypothetical protein
VAPVFPAGNPLQRFTRRAGRLAPRGRAASGSWRDLQGRPRLRHCGTSRSAVSRTPARVASRWPSSPALLGLCAGTKTTALACEGLPERMRRGVGSTSSPALLTFASPLETQSSSRGPSPPIRGTPPLRGALRRPEGRCRREGRVRTPLLGFSKDCPSVDVSVEHPLPARARAAGSRGTFAARCQCRAPRGLDRRAATFGPEMPASGLVPPLPFLPATTVCSARCLAGLLRPAADRGVRYVSSRGGGPPGAGPSGSTPEGALASGIPERISVHCHSRGASTLRSVPLADSRAVSPRPLPSRRQVCPVPNLDRSRGTALARSVAAPPTSRPSSIDESVAPRRPCSRRVARCSHGLATHVRTAVSVRGGSLRRRAG